MIETRPDEINPEELAWLRRLGVTKVQMGVQSLDDAILRHNLRGHTVLDSLRACALLRAAGFKIVLHWMPNMLGATLNQRSGGFFPLMASCQPGLGFNPDEIKIYPTQLLENTALHESWQAGAYQPYSTEELIQLIADIKPGVPEYCRINRIIRDIPSSHVVEGNRRTSLREDVRLSWKNAASNPACASAAGKCVRRSSARRACSSMTGYTMQPVQKSIFYPTIRRKADWLVICACPCRCLWKMCRQDCERKAGSILQTCGELPSSARCIFTGSRWRWVRN